MTDDQQVADPTTDQLPSGPVKEVPAQEPLTPPPQVTPAVQQPDLDTRLADFEARIAKRLEEKDASYQQYLQRLQQSQRASMAELRKAYQAQTAVLDGLVKDGLLDADQARLRKVDLRDQLDRAESTPPPQAAEYQQPPRDLNAIFQRRCTRIVADLGLSPADPEVKELAGIEFPTSDLEEAESQFLKKANVAARKKEKRVAQEEADKGKQQAAQQQAAQQKAVPINLGASSGVPRTAADIAKELNKLLDNPEIRDPAQAKVWQKRVDELSAALERAS